MKKIGIIGLGIVGKTLFAWSKKFKLNMYLLKKSIFVLKNYGFKAFIKKAIRLKILLL